MTCVGTKRVLTSLLVPFLGSLPMMHAIDFVLDSFSDLFRFHRYFPPRVVAMGEALVGLMIGFELRQTQVLRGLTYTI
jgi:hypothetical protein